MNTSDPNIRERERDLKRKNEVVLGCMDNMSHMHGTCNMHRARKMTQSGKASAVQIWQPV